MKNEEIKRTLIEAIKSLYKNDYSLIRRGCCERSIVFRLGIILKDFFHDYNVDCEYNKNGEVPKNLHKRRFNFPDLIVHKRETNNNNILIIEIKTPNDTKEKHLLNDFHKLSGFTGEVEYSYKLGAHVFLSNKLAVFAWYEGGRYVYIDQFAYEDDELKEYEKDERKKILKFVEFYTEELFYW
jgi:hypothetical protein